jgi:hypothetical protein
VSATPGGPIKNAQAHAIEIHGNRTSRSLRRPYDQRRQPQSGEGVRGNCRHAASGVDNGAMHDWPWNWLTGIELGQRTHLVQADHGGYDQAVRWDWKVQVRHGKDRPRICSTGSHSRICCTRNG